MPSANALNARLNGIREILLAHHTAGSHLPSATKGAEREVLVREFLSKIFPPPFRFGSGAIVDSSGSMSGQLDVVVEFPFLPSFPTPGAPDRLYLVESVGVVIEVKSNLTSQWKQVQKSATAVRALQRSWRAHGSFDSKGIETTHTETISRVPFIVVAYRGPKKPQTLNAMIEKCREQERPDAALVIESGAYSGCQLCASTMPASGPGGLLAFSNDLAWLIRNVTWAAPVIAPYLQSLVAKHVG